MCILVWVSFHLIGILCASYAWLSVPSSRFGKFSPIISSNIFSVPFSLSSPSGTRWACFILSRRSHMLLSYFFHLSFCLLFWLSDFHYSVFQITMWSMLFSLLIILISVIELSSFDWFIFIVSSLLLQWSAFLRIIFLNSCRIFFLPSFLTQCL